ncbi:MAG: cell division protein FtsX [Methylothermaceae bacterium]|nr:cell division protein FtsX [Methylothermaceae bacterium]
MTLMAIGVTLALPLTFYLALDNLYSLSGRFEASWRISLYLQPELSESEGIELLTKLRGHEAVAEAKLIDKEAGLADFRRYSGFGEVLDALEENPLPVVIEVLPEKRWRTPQRLRTLVEEWREYSAVDLAQWDMHWLQRLRALLQMAERGGILLGGILGLAVLLTVGNTIRLELQSRQPEIEVMKLLGATHRFIRRPFLYAGFWYGWMGGLLGWLTVGGIWLALQPPVQRLVALYNGSFSLHFLSLGEILEFWMFSCGLGMLGAWLVATRHLWRLKV